MALIFKFLKKPGVLFIIKKYADSRFKKEICVKMWKVQKSLNPVQRSEEV